MQYAFSGDIFSLPETEDFIKKYAAKAEEQVGIGALYIRGTGLLVGFAGLLPYSMVNESYELGFVLAPSYWGRGYATEIGHGQIALAQALGKQEIFALVSPDNHASRAVLDKLDMQYHRDIMLLSRGKRECYRKEIQ